MISHELEDWLNSHDNFENGKLSRRATRPTLERMKTLCKHMGDPQENIKAIHITGTNGKTSTTRISESLMRAKGFYTGTISSPHLAYMNERVCLDSIPCSDYELEESLRFIKNVEESFEEVSKDLPSYFEIFVASGFEIMNKVATDIALIEVGMGGLYDATNVCNSQVSVITNVELDHMAYLGDTREKIAIEKSGIIKENNSVVISEQDHSISQIFIEQAQKVNARPVIINEDFKLLSNEPAVGGRLLSFQTLFNTYEDKFLPLLGEHQGMNALTAVVACEEFLGGPLGDEIIEIGFGQASSPGRLEVLERNPLIIIDGAHNVAGAQALARTLESDFAPMRKIYVLGLTKEKDAYAMINALQIDVDDVVIATAADSKRAMEVSDLAKYLNEEGIDSVFEIPSSKDAIEYAKSIALDDDQIIVTGSLYVVGEVRSHLV
ncbi:MAG: folylpolyglutamate synthase/dihydrofolate synthase family protein [Acidimicrobiia bacterium]